MPRTAVTREMFIPKAADLFQDDQSSAVIATWTDEHGRPCLRGFTGRRAKPSANFFFRSTESRDAARDRFLESIRMKEAAAKKTPHNVEVGAVLYTSWGWEQTNIDFFQVTRVSEKSIWLRQIGCDTRNVGWCSDMVRAKKDEFVGEEFAVRAFVRHGGLRASVDGKNLYLDDGREHSQTSYA